MAALDGMWVDCLVGTDYGRCRVHKCSRSDSRSISYVHTVAGGNSLSNGYGISRSNFHSISYAHAVADGNFLTNGYGNSWDRARVTSQFDQHTHAYIYFYAHADSYSHN